METTPKNIAVKINDDLSVDVHYFLTDEGLGTGSEFYNMVIRGDFVNARQISQIYSKRDADNDEKQKLFVIHVVRSYYEAIGTPTK